MKPYQFPRILQKLLGEADGMSQRELARRSGLSPSNITQICDGQRCTPEVLQGVIGVLGKAVGTGNAASYLLLIAHLHDEIQRAGLDPAHVVIRHVDGAVLSELDLSVEMNAHLGLIAKEAQQNEDVAGVVEDLAHMIMRHEAALADARGAKFYPFPAGESARVAEVGSPAKIKKKSPRGAGPTPPVPPIGSAG